MVQMFKQLTRDCAGNMFELWKLFLKCLRESQVDCVFIIIDSIDYLQDAQASDGSGEEEAVLGNDALVVSGHSARRNATSATKVGRSKEGGAPESHVLATIPDLSSSNSAEATLSSNNNGLNVSQVVIQQPPLSKKPMEFLQQLKACTY
ncbi:hypothetical protein LI328DRAFT_144668 [Trichoderma asperelloides]|nr:hypothetical protein LI328DRAFT_144668 [Trichoderma asperelloides]